MTESKNDTTPRFQIKGQYIKDVSFENPYAPHSLLQMEERPRIDIDVELSTGRFNDEHFELSMHIAAKATGKDTTLFVLDLKYAALVQCTNVPEDKLEPILRVDCAFVLFPFARRVVADMTRDGGFPPLLLEPIDFYSLYMNSKTPQ